MNGMRIKPGDAPTPRQRMVVNFIRLYAAEHRGIPPTLRDIGDALGIGINAVADHLRLLQKKGVVTWEPFKARTLVVVGG